MKQSHKQIDEELIEKEESLIRNGHKRQLSLEAHLLKYWKVIDRHSINNARSIIWPRVKECRHMMKVLSDPKDREYFEMFKSSLALIYMALMTPLNRKR